MKLSSLCCFACVLLCSVTGQARDVYRDEHVIISYVVPQQFQERVIYEHSRRPGLHVMKGDGGLRMVWSQHRNFRTHLSVLLVDDSELWRSDYSNDYIAHELSEKLRQVGRVAVVTTRELSGNRWWRVEERNRAGTVIRIYYATPTPADLVLHCSLMLDEEKAKPVKPLSDEWAKLESGLEHLVASVEINAP
jgi:hypothetical protein